MRTSLAALLFFCASLMQAGEKSRVIESQETVVINSLSDIEYTVYQKIYVADEPGRDLAHFNIFTNEFIKLKSASAKILDAKGKTKKKFKKRDLTEAEPPGYGILASGSVYHRLNMSQAAPLPYTIEKTYTVKLNSLFIWPDWNPQESIPVDLAQLDIIAPADFNYYSFSPRGLQATSRSQTTATWKQEHLEPWPEEDNMPPEVFEEYAVLFSADSFIVGDYAGSARSWQSIGEFYTELSRDQYTLRHESVADLKIVNAATVRDSIAQIYDYVQRATRYVGIELGIHGWRPHSSQWVCDNKYGDCKDLATFFISILRIYHINAYPVLILTRDKGKIYPEFPNKGFNHVIACVPLVSDTLWVDCTVDDGRIDIIPGVDQGCNVLLIDGKYSRMLQTPIQGPENNVYGVDAVIDLTSSGAAKLQATLTYAGQASMNNRGHFQSVTLKEQREAIIWLFDGTAPGMQLDTFHVSNLEDKYAPLIIYLEAQVPHLATRTGNRLFLNLGLPVKLGWNGEHPSRRTTAMFASIPYSSSSSITIRYSDMLELEALPGDANIETEFGKVYQSTQPQEDTVVYSIERSHAKMIIDISDYEAYYSYRVEAKKSANAPMVFKQR